MTGEGDRNHIHHKTLLNDCTDALNIGARFPISVKRVSGQRGAEGDGGGGVTHRGG